VANIDWAFVKEQEDIKLEAYTLNNAPQAGVTIGMGFDLGHWTVSDLIAAGLSQESVAKLSPFMSLKGLAAEQALDKAKREQGEITITKDEAGLLKRYGEMRITNLLKTKFNAARAASVPSFDMLPSEAQTVLASVSWQYGPALHRRTPRFWGFMITGDFVGAVKELRNFGDAFTSRRRREADLLEKAIKSSAIVSRTTAERPSVHKSRPHTRTRYEFNR
jgi:GH24 family phage-related lysozyme (muramidase)